MRCAGTEKLTFPPALSSTCSRISSAMFAKYTWLTGTWNCSVHCRDSSPILVPRTIQPAPSAAGFTADTSDREWERLMMREWGREDIRAALAGCPGIVEQEAWHQHGAKLSYYFQDGVDSVLPLVDARIGPWRDSIKKVVCMDYYLDLMPRWSGKGEPVGYLARKLGIPDDRVLVAGDSGNDRDMMDRGFKSIIVANHASDLADLVGKSGTFRSSRPGAAGVLEGLAHFGISARINEGSVS